MPNPTTDRDYAPLRATPRVTNTIIALRRHAEQVHASLDGVRAVVNATDDPDKRHTLTCAVGNAESLVRDVEWLAARLTDALPIVEKVAAFERTEMRFLSDLQDEFYAVANRHMHHDRMFQGLVVRATTIETIRERLASARERATGERLAYHQDGRVFATPYPPE